MADPEADVAYGCVNTGGPRLRSDGTYQRVIDHPEGSDLAIERLIAWSWETFGDGPDCVSVRWTDQHLPVEVDWSDEPIGASGLYISCTDVWVRLGEDHLEYRPDAPLSGTSLAHEVIGHCMRHYLIGDPDAKHEDPEWWGDLEDWPDLGGYVEEAREVLERGNL